MPSAELLLPFLLATFMFAYMPGPALLYTVAQTMVRGRRAGFAAVLGIHLGCYVHVLGATLGLSAVLTHVPSIYLALKILGAAYLVYLGYRILTSPPESRLPAVQTRSARRSFIDSVLVEVLNPKAALFFIAFLPQFVDPSAAWPVWVQFLVMGTFVNFAFSSADIVAVLLTERIVRVTKASAIGQRIAKVIGGSVLMGLGAHLALSRQT
ncbi:MAG: LysE family translocator [Pseudomonadota bacterium]